MMCVHKKLARLSIAIESNHSISSKSVCTAECRAVHLRDGDGDGDGDGDQSNAYLASVFLIHIFQAAPPTLSAPNQKR